MSHQEALTSYVAHFVAELAKSGLKHVVISPGSRSTPLAMVLAQHPDLNVHVHVDERAAAFFALGIAKAQKDPVAILCTSGTAAANYYPAIVEAYYARVPLVVLTADRPHELRDVGAPQAIDQVKMYGSLVKWFVEMAPPENTATMLRYVRTVAQRAVATAKAAPAGPVHLNFPFREPLVPDIHRRDLFAVSERRDAYVNVRARTFDLADEAYREIAKTLQSCKRGLIVCGPVEDDDFKEPLLCLATHLRFPILADPLSRLRAGSHDKTMVVSTYDTILRNEEAKQALKPDVILRFGGTPVSKPLAFFLNDCHDVMQLVIDGGGGWRDPGFHGTEMIHCDEATFCKRLIPYLDPKGEAPYAETWRRFDEAVKASLRRIQEEEALSEGKLFSLLQDVLPEQATLFVGNSMPIRDADAFFHTTDREITIFGNRGVNGIDGTISTALGVGAVRSPLYVVVGDLTFFHDLNGLIAAKMYDIDVTVIIINNNGGGIFSFLPQANDKTHFETLFGTPLDLRFRAVADMFDGTYTLVSTWDDFYRALEESKSSKGLHVIEIPTDRDKNAEQHRMWWTSVSREISRLLRGESE